MNNFSNMTDKQFFQALLNAAKEEYREYVVFKAKDEGLLSYSEPVYEAALEEAQIRIDKL